MMNDSYQRFRDFYAGGGLPWDQVLPPPEVIAEMDVLTPGRALDLGCGYGRAAIYMAHRGWEVEAVDFVPQAITVARLRAATAGVQVRFHLAPVTDLSFLQGPVDYALDVGCAHSLEFGALTDYKDSLSRLLRPGGQLMLFARLREEDEDVGESGPRGVPVSRLRTIFNGDFALDREERGWTETPNGSWESGWFWFRRRFYGNPVAKPVPSEHEIEAMAEDNDYREMNEQLAESFAESDWEAFIEGENEGEQK